jgi:FlaA1/EpsC-like NDP-sugar epimerase
MLQVFRHHVSMSAFASMLADVLVCFLAALLAAASLYGGQLLDIRDVVQSPGVMLFAVSFSVVMAFMYAFVGLYRPNPIGLAASLRRTGFAVIVGSFLTYLLLRLAADRFRAEQIIGAAIVYLFFGLVIVRGALHLMRRVTAIPRVLIIGTGDEARGVAGDLKSLRRIARDVVGFYPTSGDTGYGDITGLPHKVFQRSTPIVDIVEGHGI